MSAVGAFLVFMGLTVAAAVAAADRRDRRFASSWAAVSWLVLSALTVVVHLNMPFAGGGDDEDYYRLASRPVASVAQLFDLARFVDETEQSGYPWALSIVSSALGNDLLGLKFFNLALFLLTCVVWSRIGALLADSEFARRLSVWTVFLSPLWFYFFFLLKDLAIVLLQSLFLLGLVKLWIGQTRRGWLIVATASIVTLLFRAPLVVQNAGIAGICIVLQTTTAKRKQRATGTAVVGIALVAILLVLASNEAFLRLLGIYAESRVLGSEAMWEQGRTFNEESQAQRSLFPALYLLSETAGLNVSTWQRLDASWLRGVLALPWIGLFVPVVLLGLPWLFSAPADCEPPEADRSWWMKRRLISTPWSVIVVFIASSVAVSWVVGDTTRWRLADMPALTAIAACALNARRPIVPILCVATWITILVIGFIAVYLSRVHPDLLM